MAKSSTTYQPGQSGNPKGRPPKQRALTTLLEKGGAKRFLPSDQTGEAKPVQARKLLVQHVWEALATGSITFADGAKLTLDGQEYIALLKLVLNQVDGPPRAEVDVTTKGEAIQQSGTVDAMKDLFQMMGALEKDDSDHPPEV